MFQILQELEQKCSLGVQEKLTRDRGGQCFNNKYATFVQRDLEVLF